MASNVVRKYITRSDVTYAFLDGIKGGTFGCTFISKADGTERRSTYTTNIRKYERTGQGLAYDPRGTKKDGTPYNLLQVCDLVAARARKRGVTNEKGNLVGDDRMIPLEGILSIRANGLEYIVQD
jgi:hypothetical protein